MSDETVETAEVVSDSSAEVSAPESVPESMAAEAPPEMVESPAPEVFDWNGEISSLQDSEWFSGLDDNVRSTISQGIESKYQNWQRGYTEKFEDMSKRRKALDEMERSVRDQEIRVQRWMNGDVDPMVEKQKELEALQQTHAGAIKALREEHAGNVEKLRTASKSELEEAATNYKEVKAKLDTYAAKERQIQEQQHEARVQEFVGWLNTEAPDIADNDEAFYWLASFIKLGATPQDALVMARARYPAPAAPEAVAEPVVEPEPVPEPEAVPESVKLMNMGTGQAARTEAGETRGVSEILELMRREALMESGGIVGS